MPFILPHIAHASSLTAPSTAGAAAAGAAAAVTLEPLSLMLQLCQTILVPTLLGASVRGLVPGAAAAIDANKRALSYINAGLLASVPWMQVGGRCCTVCRRRMRAVRGPPVPVPCVLRISSLSRKPCTSNCVLTLPGCCLSALLHPADQQNRQSTHVHRHRCPSSHGCRCCWCAHPIPDCQHPGVQVQL